MGTKKSAFKERLNATLGENKLAKRHFAKHFEECLARMRKECNTSIHTVSILAWHNLADKGDLKLLMREQREVTKMEANALNYIYKKLRDEYFTEFGFGDREKYKNQLKLEICNAYCDMVINDDHRQYSKIKRAMDRLDKLNKNDSKNNLSLIEQATLIKKIVGVEFNLNTCSIAEFTGYAKMAEKQSKNGRK